jgi:phage shock protein PspC (stress-responsive transcriptional regulator)
LKIQTLKSQDALLAGVCQYIAQALHWNVWAIRAVFILLLLTKTVLAIVIYAVLALLLEANNRYRGKGPCKQEDSSLQSEELGTRNRRIQALDQRFRQWEDSIKD